jgi:hypothetical protein
MNERKPQSRPLALGLILAAALLRLAPHPPNFAPVGSIALFGGAKLKGWQAYMVPLLAMLITDPILSRMAGYPAYSQATPIIYFSFLLYVILGRSLLTSKPSLLRIASVAAAGSLQFFLVTNFFEWWEGISMYPHTPAGLVACFSAALPFFSRTLIADLFYTGVLFAAYALLTRRSLVGQALPPFTPKN